MAEIHLVMSKIWMGHKNTQTHKKHDDMLSCCATKKAFTYLIKLKESQSQLKDIEYNKLETKKLPKACSKTDQN